MPELRCLHLCSLMATVGQGGMTLAWVRAAARRDSSGRQGAQGYVPRVDLEDVDPWSRADDDGPARPVSVTVMAEHPGGPVWDRPNGFGEPLYDLARLGVPGHLIERLQAWNSRYEALSLTNFAWESPQAEGEWHRHGRELSVALQAVLPAVEVYYWEGPDHAVPVRSKGRRQS